MKTIVTALIAAGVATGTATSAAAQTRPGFEVGAEVAHYAYRERYEGQTIVHDDGTLVKLRLSYVETLGGGFFLRAGYDVATGKIDYSDDEGARLDDVDQTLGQIELHVGKDFQSGPASFTLFTGVGGRALLDESGGRVSTAGAAGYDRVIRYAFIPVGIAAAVPTGKGTRLLGSVQYNHVFGGKSESKLSDVNPALPDLDLDLDRGHGFEASALMAVPLGRREVRFGPMFRAWNVSQSRSERLSLPEGLIEFFEPASRTKEISFRVSFAF